MLRKQQPRPRISALFSALADRGPEDVIVLAMIVPELELRNVKRQVLAADLVESEHDAVLEDVGIGIGPT
jgi:hypothetical protein